MKLALGFALAMSLTTPFARAQENTLTAQNPQPNNTSAFKKYSGEVTFGLMGREFSGDVVGARFSRATAEVSLNAEFTNWLEAKLSAIQLFTSGATSNLYAAPEGGSGTNGLFIDEGSLILKPLEGLKIKGGILPVVANPISSVMIANSWAAYSLEAEQTIGPLILGANATQGIPTARSTSNRLVDQDTLPMYTAGTLHGELKAGDSGFSTKVAATHFIFTDPSAQSAQDSQQIGSTVVGNSKTAFLYAYDYRGMEYALQLKQELFRGDEVTLKGSLTENSEAPENMNQGTKVALSYKRAADVWEPTLTLTRFSFDSDVMPATYTSPSYSYTNRQGNSASLKIKNKIYNFAINGSYTKSDLLDANAQAARWQGDNEIITLGGELSHDLF